MAKSCLDCRIVYSGEGSRCPRCLREWNQRRNSVRSWYRDPAYIRASALVRASATRCHLCGKGPIDGDPWTADHVSASELQPAHRSCNSGRGRNHPVFGRKLGL